jgi:methylmalonyl-CoA/ethylmalonyl-CoA epimerase
MLERIDHIAIAVRDINRALPYYVETLKLPVVGDELLPDVGVRLVYLDAGNTFIQLVQPTTSPSITQFLEERGEGLHHICFSVQAIPQTLATLGVESQAGIFAGGRQRYCAFLAQPPNNIQIELTENTPYHTYSHPATDMMGHA